MLISNITRLGRGAALLISLASIVVLLAGPLALIVGGGRLLSVQSGSMAPTFKKGDVLLIVPASQKKLKPGEVISYKSPGSSLLISHRLVKFDPRSGSVVTEGDASNAADPPFQVRQVKGRALAVIPDAGKLLDKMRNPWIITPTFYLPVCLFLAGEFQHLALFFRRPFYQVHDRL